MYVSHYLLINKITKTLSEKIKYRQCCNEHVMDINRKVHICIRHLFLVRKKRIKSNFSF